ncbi:unnamed protein product [Amoebophrya sp. A120]|nr:unnamed protein product [Amoebophrya sp. A120]|eukprot:GSA120T00012914001.1
MQRLLGRKSAFRSSGPGFLASVSSTKDNSEKSSRYHCHSPYKNCRHLHSRGTLSFFSPVLKRTLSYFIHQDFSTMAAAIPPEYPKCKFTYFPIAGAGERVRLAFVMTGKEFEDNRVKFPDWQALKPTTPYGQMPLLDLTFEDGSTKRFCQSIGLMTYVARQFDTTKTLYPEHDPVKCALVDDVRGLSDDMFRSWTPALYIGMSNRHVNFGHPEEWPERDATVQKLRTTFLAEELPRFMGYLKKLLEENGGPFLCGKDVTIADLQWLPQLRYYQGGIADHVPTDSLDAFPWIIEYIAKMLEVPQIKAYYKL